MQEEATEQRLSKQLTHSSDELEKQQTAFRDSIQRLHQEKDSKIEEIIDIDEEIIENKLGIRQIEYEILLIETNELLKLESKREELEEILKIKDNLQERIDDIKEHYELKRSKLIESNQDYQTRIKDLEVKVRNAEQSKQKLKESISMLSDIVLSKVVKTIDLIQEEF